jgi:predicted nucleic acid-binding protein
VKRVLVDTNVLLSFLTDRNAAQQRQAAALLEEAASGVSQLLLHQIVLTELVYVLRNLYAREPREIGDLLRDLFELPGVDAVDALPWPRVLELWPSSLKDFADAALVAAGLQHRADAVATFDRELARKLGRFRLGDYWGG